MARIDGIEQKDAAVFQEWLRTHFSMGGLVDADAFDPWNSGEMKNADAYGGIKGICGDTMEIWLRIRDGIISEARFQTNGCFSSQICGGAAVFLSKGETILDALRISPARIMDLMAQIPGVELHCAILAASTLFRAIADYILKNEQYQAHAGCADDDKFQNNGDAKNV